MLCRFTIDDNSRLAHLLQQYNGHVRSGVMVYALGVKVLAPEAVGLKVETATDMMDEVTSIYGDKSYRKAL